MKSIRMPTFASFFGPQPKAPGRHRLKDGPGQHRGRGRAKKSDYVPQHRQGTIQPGTGPGRHRRSDPPPPGPLPKIGRHALPAKPGKRLTPANDR